MTRHRETPEYQESVRKSGVAHGESGLTATEQEKRTAVRNAKFAIRTARDLDRRWNARTLTYRNWHLGWYYWDLLNAYWDGSLQRRLEESKSQSQKAKAGQIPCAERRCSLGNSSNDGFWYRESHRLRSATEQTIDCVLLQSQACASEQRELTHVVWP